jgi:hypothetical protein
VACIILQACVLQDKSVLDPVLDHKPRGFVGRPLIGLLFSVGLGILGPYVGSRLHLGDSTVLVMVGGIVVAVFYLWHKADEKS